MSHFIASLRRQFGTHKSNELVRRHQSFARTRSVVLRKFSEQAQREHWGERYWVFFECLSYEVHCSIAAGHVDGGIGGFRIQLNSLRDLDRHPMVAVYRPNRESDGRPWELREVRRDFRRNSLRLDLSHNAGVAEMNWAKGLLRVGRPDHLFVQNAARLPQLEGLPIHVRT